MRLQEFLNPFCEAAENAFLQPNSNISPIEVNLCLEHKPNVSFKMLFLGFVQLNKLNFFLDSESLKHLSSKSCVLIFQSEWE